jgi:GNAT superfamily N-acetyltransferase
VKSEDALRICKNEAHMNETQSILPLTVTPFKWVPGDHWRGLWELRHYQLVEAGIFIPLEENPAPPHNAGRDEYEWDYDHIDEIYLHGAGGFWLAWWEGCPVGHVAGQDLGRIVELRHMYVRSEYRKRGIGACLVQVLLDQCKVHGVEIVRLWTASDGPGRRLYEHMGFQVISWPGEEEMAELIERTNYTPGEDELRMQLLFIPPIAVSSLR